MQIPVHLTGKGVELTAEQESQIQDEANRLERFFDRLVSCRVVVSVPNRRSRGEPVAWTFRLFLTVPGGELAVNRQAKPTFRDALDDAFSVARRRLQDYARELRGDVKAPAEQPVGRVIRLYGQEGYGFIAGEDGHEIYFHQNSVPDGGFGRLTLGTEVRYVEVEGEQGPQASTLIPLSRSPSAPAGEGGGAPWS